MQLPSIKEETDSMVGLSPREVELVSEDVEARESSSFPKELQLLFNLSRNGEIQLAALEDPRTEAHNLLRNAVAAVGHAGKVDEVNIVKELRVISAASTEQSGTGRNASISVHDFAHYWRKLRARLRWRRARMLLMAEVKVALDCRRLARKEFVLGEHDVRTHTQRQCSSVCTGEQSCGVLRPHNWIVISWLCCFTPLVIYVFLTAPYQITFQQYPCPGTWNFVMDVVADVAFFLDIVLHFNLAYYEQGERQQDVLVTDRRKICVHYLKSWFWLDLVALLPFNYIEWYLLNKSTACGGAGEPDSTVGAEGLLRALRFARVFKAAAKVQKIRSLDRLMRHFEQQFEIFYRIVKVLKLMKLSLAVCAVAHIIGCMWYGLGDAEDPKSWLYGRFVDTSSCSCIGCEHLTTQAACDACTTPDIEDTLSCWTPATPNLNRYATSVYFACTTLTTVGYGDISPAQGRMTELVLCVLFMLAGINMFGVVIGKIGELFSSGDPAAVRAAMRVSLVDRFLEMRRVGSTTRHRVRMHLTKKYDSCVDTVNMGELLKELPYNLAEAVLQAATVEYYSLDGRAFWKGLQLDLLSPPEIRLLCLRLEPLHLDKFAEVYAQGSADSSVYFVLDGCVEQSARHKVHATGQANGSGHVRELEVVQLRLLQDQCFGVVEALKNMRCENLQHWRQRSSSVHTLEKSDLVYLSATSLAELDSKFMHLKSNIVDCFEELACDRTQNMVKQILTIYNNGKELCAEQKRMDTEAQENAPHNGETTSAESRTAFLRSGRQDYVSLKLHDLTARLMDDHNGENADAEDSTFSDAAGSDDDVFDTSKKTTQREELQDQLEQLGRKIWEVTSTRTRVVHRSLADDRVDEKELRREINRIGESFMNVLLRIDQCIEDELQYLPSNSIGLIQPDEFNKWWRSTVLRLEDSREVRARKTGIARSSIARSSIVPPTVPGLTPTSTTPAAPQRQTLSRQSFARPTLGSLPPQIVQGDGFAWASDWSDRSYETQPTGLIDAMQTEEVQTQLQTMATKIDKLESTMRRIAESLEQSGNA